MAVLGDSSCDAVEKNGKYNGLISVDHAILFQTLSFKRTESKETVVIE